MDGKVRTALLKFTTGDSAEKHRELVDEILAKSAQERRATPPRQIKDRQILYLIKNFYEVKTGKRHTNDCTANGLKTISRAIGDQQARLFTCVCRDRGTLDGGRKGELTTTPAELDAIVKRAWQTMYARMGGCINTAVDFFVEKYTSVIARFLEVEWQEIDAQMVYDLFAKTNESVGALDGWMPKELSLLSF